MDNFLNLIFSEVNIVLTILVILLVLYWLFTSLSGIDFDYDVDIDVDLDMEVDVDADMGNGADLEFQDISSSEIDKSQVTNKRRTPLKWWQVFLIYFNFVGIPFMFTFTAWIFFWWIITLLATSITGSYESNFGFLLMLIAIIPALIITKLFTSPFKVFFKKLNKDGDLAVDFTGREATLLSTISGNKMGNAELIVDDNIMNIYVKSLDGSKLSFRESVLIIKQSSDKNYFYVTKTEYKL